ncbi:Lin-54-like protein [Trema orientale]|uniref:Lin-54-like protein n=1 Tax=Trema orientale TaxID=63057 RepID=A0A2P5FWD7_TREOI|nr:Lin-54-like protein [Trema orientale]
MDMDTPKKNQIGTPVSKFEDSPVFNYINSLSPIKPVKSLHITQTFSSLSFGSLPSVFTSPHVSSHKESRFLRRYSCADPSKPELSSENGNKATTSEGIVMDTAQLYSNSSELHENGKSEANIGEASVEPQNEGSTFVIELPRVLKYDCGSPDCVSMPCGVEADFATDSADPSTSLVPHVPDVPEMNSSDNEAQFQELCLSEQRKQGTVCDWESLISDAADILIFNSPNGTEAFKGLIQNSLEPVTRFCTSFAAEFSHNEINNEHQMQIVDPVSSEQHNGEEPFSQTGDASSLEDVEQTQDRFADTNSNRGMASNQSEIKDNEDKTCVAFACKSVFSLHRGMRRRCLDFEAAGARRKNLEDGSNNSSVSSQHDEDITANEKQPGFIRPCGESSSRRMLPGIGLHLNALATTSKDCKITKNENLSSGIQIRLPGSTVSIHSPTAGQEGLDKSLIPISSEIDNNTPENGVQLLQDASQAPGSLTNEEFNQNSPKKKRRRLDNAGETEGCKRCNCKKSKCLKLYCECFAAGVYCIEPCSCQECFNKPIHEDTVLATRKQIESRNPLAFAPKVIRSSDSVPEFGDESSKTPASARHKRGCNCKKSSCLKKYCECYQGGVGCSISCRCEGCKNAFGRKDGSVLTGTEEQDEEETEACEKSLVDKPLQKIEIQNNEEQNPGSSLPITPLRISRPLLPIPFSSKGKPPRSSFLTGTSSSGLYSQKHGKPSILRSQPKFEKHVQTIPDDEMPEILRGDGSPTTGIKTASPNSKRISPPHCHFGSSSPGRRSGRKLILQSIPSFPSLTPQH